VNIFLILFFTSHSCFPAPFSFVDDTAEGYEDYEPSKYSKDYFATICSFVNSVNDFG